MAAKKRALPQWMKLASSNNEENSVQSNTTENKLCETDSSKSRKKFKEADRMKAAAEFDKVLQDNLPELKFNGSIIYSFHKSDCCALCEDIELVLCDVENAFIGFDMEWPVTYEVGKEALTAVIQICTGPKVCYIFHISVIGSLPRALQCLITNHSIQKVGVNIEGDLWKLERDFEAPMYETIKKSTIELGKFANKVLNSSETWSLEGLVRHLFKKKISKEAGVRKGDWTQYPLTEEQKNYAATDAFASYLVYEKLKSLVKTD